MARRLRVEPYDPNAVDGDGDGIVQENTAWERPVGTRLIDEFGNEIRVGLMSMQRPARMRVVDQNGNDVRYIPTYATVAERRVSETPLGSIGAPSLAESGVTPVPTLADRGLRTIGETMDDVDAIVNPQTVVGEDAPELPSPKPSMLTKLASSEPAELSEMYSSLHSGIPLLERLTSSSEGFSNLQNDWNNTYTDYFSFQLLSTPNRRDQWTPSEDSPSLDITVDQFIELAVSLQQNGSVDSITDSNGNEIPSETVALAILATLDFIIERDANARIIMKDSVASQLASRMVGNELSPASMDFLLQRMVYDYPSWAKYGGIGRALPSMTERRQLLTDPGRIGIQLNRLFSDEVISPENLQSYLEWGLGGERPLWIDSPDLNDSVRAVFALPPVAIIPDDGTSLDYPLVMPGTFLSITEFDDDITKEAKINARQVMESLNSRPDIYHLREFGEFARSISFRREEAVEEVSKNLYISLVQSLGPEYDRAKRYTIEDLLWPTSRSTRGLTTMEQRLLIFAASDLCDDTRRQMLIDAVGWDFTKQYGWDKFTKAVKYKYSAEGLRGLHQGLPVDEKFTLINRLTLASFTEEDGQPLRAGSIDLSDTTYQSTIDFLLEMSQIASVVEGTSAEFEELKRYLDAPRPGRYAALSEKDDWVRGFFDRYMRCSSRADESTPVISDLKTFIDGMGASTDESISPEHIALIQDEPLYDVYRYISSKYVSQWAVSSNGYDPLSHAIQEEAQILFGLEDDEIVQFDDIFQEGRLGSTLTAQEMRNRIEQTKKEQRDLIRLFLRAQYENTQEYYRSRGITDIPVARGMNLSYDDPIIQELLKLAREWDESQEIDSNVEMPPSVEVSSVMRPLSSFATVLPAVRNFVSDRKPFDQNDNYGVVLISRVPVHQILGTPYTGNGCLNEYEAVVIGRSLNTRMFLAYSLTSAYLFDPAVGRSITGRTKNE